LDYLPLWGVFAATVALTLLAGEAGFALGNCKRRRSKEARNEPEGEIVAALLGLLALLLAFTFSQAASRFEARKGLVLDEANAIGTTWLRAGLVPEPHRTEIRRLLREYLEVRLGAIPADRVQQALTRSEELHGRLWAEAVATNEREPRSIVIGLFITSLNEVIDLHSKRVTLGLRNRISAVIWETLYFVAVLAIGAIGYHAGLLGARQSLAILPLVLVFSAVLLLIADLDRPQEGLFKVSQQALADLRTLMAEGGPGSQTPPQGTDSNSPSK
jgi:hypothetical protein